MCGAGCAALLFWTCGESVCAAGRLRRDGALCGGRRVRGEKRGMHFAGKEENR